MTATEIKARAAELAKQDELYVADLDAIAGNPTLDLNVAAIRKMTRSAVPVWVDAGLK